MVLSPENTCLVMTVVPLGLLGCYFGLLSKRPEGRERLAKDAIIAFADKVRLLLAFDSTYSQCVEVQVRIVRGLFPFMGPLFLVFFCEYTINQGLYEHLLFDNGPMSRRSVLPSKPCNLARASPSPDLTSHHAPSTAHSTGPTRPSTRLASLSPAAALRCSLSVDYGCLQVFR